MYRDHCERGVGVSVNATMLSDTLYVVGIVEVTRSEVRFRKEPMNMCPCDNEERK